MRWAYSSRQVAVGAPHETDHRPAGQPATVSVHPSYCRICQGLCGVLVTVDRDRITHVAGDPANPLSKGFTCPKGRRGPDFHHGPERLVVSHRRARDGHHVPICVDDALTEIAARLTAIVEEHGPDAVGLFTGTQYVFATLTPPIARSWFQNLGSHKMFSTMTIDQSAKWIVPLRMGEYIGGRQSFESSDVWLLAGTNPLVSLNGGAGEGILMHNPSSELRAAKDRGLQLIVIDPRRTETAARADLHLQPRPGYDALVFAGLLNVVLTEGLYDRDFCEMYVEDLDELIAAVCEISPSVVEAASDVAAEDLVRAARMFGHAARGMATTGTGLCMGPHSNLAEHLVTCLNVVCGRYLRQGDRVLGPAGLAPATQPQAQVVPPNRTWETGFRSRIGGHGLIRGQLPSGILADEILEPGADRIRALIVAGGNPVMALPDHARALRAFQSLDLLVSIDTRLSETAQLADFVIAPTMMYERGDHTAAMEQLLGHPVSQYAAPVLAPPDGVIEDWEFFYRLGARMGFQLQVAGRDLNMAVPPTSTTMLAWLGALGSVSLSDVAAAPHGFIPSAQATVVGPPDTAFAGNRLQLMPADVACELSSARQEPDPDSEFPLRLVVRRMREVMNSLGREVGGLAKQKYNPAYFNPDDLVDLGIVGGDVITLRSAHGHVLAVAAADKSVRRGVVSMTHSWGSLDAAQPPSLGGSNVNALVAQDSAVQTINHMATMTAVPIAVAKLAPTVQAPG
jgi:anaerobic selenocysteine-containing dehydrogenase